MHFSSSGLHSVQSSPKIADRKTEEKRESFHCKEGESREKRFRDSEERFEKGGLDASRDENQFFALSIGFCTKFRDRRASKGRSKYLIF